MSTLPFLVYMSEKIYNDKKIVNKDKIEKSKSDTSPQLNISSTEQETSKNIKQSNTPKDGHYWARFLSF
tara:strand:+ start:517 stop:723 length:207 start_codon:yes stop_codon:yes gene_type:complete